MKIFKFWWILGSFLARERFLGLQLLDLGKFSKKIIAPRFQWYFTSKKLVAVKFWGYDLKNTPYYYYRIYCQWVSTFLSHLIWWGQLYVEAWNYLGKYQDSSQLSDDHVDVLSTELRNKKTRIAVVKVEPGNNLTDENISMLQAAAYNN